MASPKRSDLESPIQKREEKKIIDWATRAEKEFKTPLHVFKNTILSPKKRYIQIRTFHGGLIPGSEVYLGLVGAIMEAMRLDSEHLPYFIRQYKRGGASEVSEEDEEGGIDELPPQVINRAVKELKYLSIFIDLGADPNMFVSPLMDVNPRLLPAFLKKYRKTIHERYRYIIQTVLKMIEGSERALQDFISGYQTEGKTSEEFKTEGLWEALQIALQMAPAGQSVHLIRTISVLLGREKVLEGKDRIPPSIDPLLLEPISRELKISFAEDIPILLMYRAVHDNDHEKVNELLSKNPNNVIMIQRGIREAMEDGNVDIVRLFLAHSRGRDLSSKPLELIVLDEVPLVIHELLVLILPRSEIQSMLMSLVDSWPEHLAFIYLLLRRVPHLGILRHIYYSKHKEAQDLIRRINQDTRAIEKKFTKWETFRDNDSRRTGVEIELRALIKVSETTDLKNLIRFNQDIDRLYIELSFLKQNEFQILLSFLEIEAKNPADYRKILPTLPPVKSMTDLVTEGVKFCGDERLGISLDELKEITPRQWARLRRFHKTCFDLEDLWKWVRERTENNRPVRHPYDNSLLTQEEIQAIVDDYRTSINADAKMRPPEIKFDEKVVTLHIDPVFPQGLPFHHLYITRPGEMIDLGYVPEYTDPIDRWTDTSVILAGIRELWDKRRLLEVHDPPEEIRCCTVHLRKSVIYWLNPDGSINTQRLSNMSREVRDLL
jgi:hypothetical protein